MKRPLNNKYLKQNIFKVPHGYFETFADKTLANAGIEINSNPDVIKPTKRYVLTAWSSVAAAAVL